jgi:biotin-independent malonate decarboxylase gamma subunit
MSVASAPTVFIIDDDASVRGSIRGILATEGLRSEGFLAAAAAADAYGSARLAGHPVIALVVGHALSGGFLTHGYQANRILAFDNDGVMMHAMHKEAAARIIDRSVEELDSLGKKNRAVVLRH